MTVKQLFSTTVFCATVACPLAHGVDLRYFPSVEHYDDEEIRLHGLATLYPGRVLFEDPSLSLSTASESRESARVEDLPRDIKYIRLYRLDEAQAVLEEHQAHPALIVDFRYLRSELAAVPILDAFAQDEWLSGLTTSGHAPEGLIEKTDGRFTQRDTPVIVLCNRETAGPFEAVLNKLQRAGAIIAVGEPTAGRTGFYEKTKYAAWTLHGEIRPDEATSLVGVGFQPRIHIKTGAEENYLSYHLYEAGTSIVRLLRQENHTATDSQSDEALDTDKIEPDPVLQRGVDIVAALQVLQ
jgi:hypothetical protein